MHQANNGKFLMNQLGKEEDPCLAYLKYLGAFHLLLIFCAF